VRRATRRAQAAVPSQLTSVIQRPWYWSTRSEQSVERIVGEVENGPYWSTPVIERAVPGKVVHESST